MATATLSPQAEAKRRWLVRNSGKTCTRCGEFKRLSAYAVDAAKPDCLRSYCKACLKS